MSRSTVQNLVSTLEEEGFLLQNPLNSKYHLSFKLYDMGRRALQQFDLRAVVRPYLEKLMYEVKETVMLGILDGAEVIYVDRISYSEEEYFSFIGNRDPVYCVGIGKAILSHLPPFEQSQILYELSKTKLRHFTENTITNIDDFKQNLSLAKSRGFAISYQERLPGTVSIAAPFKDYKKKAVGAIAVHGYVNRIDLEKASSIGQIVLRVAKEISTRLGYYPSDDDDSVDLSNSAVT